MRYQVRAMAEDVVTAAIVRRLLAEFEDKYALGSIVENARGVGTLNRKINSWNNAAKNAALIEGDNTVFFMLRDADKLQDGDWCPESEIEKLLAGQEKSRNLLLRFAVAEGENWLLADYERLRKFLSLRSQNPVTPDQIRNGKEKIVALARDSKEREYRTGIIPSTGAGRPTGPRYNPILMEFIRHYWNPREAAKHSKSLRNTLNRLAKFPNK